MSMCEILSIQVVIDEDWQGSTTPYRIINGNTTYRPMDKQQVEDQIASMVYRTLWDD